MNRQLDIIRLAQKAGKNPAKLTRKEYTAFAIKARSLREKVEDGKAAVFSHYGQKFGFIESMPLPVIQANLAQCAKNECGSYKTSSDGQPICMQCDCAGKWLESKAGDPDQYCPDPKKYWDNRILSQKNEAKP